MINPRISVIIPAHNEAENIVDTLDSLVIQDFQDFETIVVCDNCTDATAEIADTYDAIVLNVNNNRASKTRNTGADQSRGEILVFNDADTLMSPNYLGEVHEAFEQGYLWGSPRLVSETGHPIGRLSTFTLNFVNKFFTYSHGNLFVKKVAFFEVGGFDERLIYCEDTDLAERLKVHDFKFLEEACVVHDERKFQERGYLREFLSMGIDGIWYFVDRNGYIEHHLASD